MMENLVEENSMPRNAKPCMGGLLYPLPYFNVAHARIVNLMVQDREDGVVYQGVLGVVSKLLALPVLVSSFVAGTVSPVSVPSPLTRWA